MSLERMPPDAAGAAYWRRNLQYLAVLLGIWFIVSFGAGILFVEQLNTLRIPGIGFWFAQQGSIYVFVILIFVYVWLMARLDRATGHDEEEPQ
jgi:putative solute:sodium symporter small subunit